MAKRQQNGHFHSGGRGGELEGPAGLAIVPSKTGGGKWMLTYKEVALFEGSKRDCKATGERFLDPESMIRAFMLLEGFGLLLSQVGTRAGNGWYGYVDVCPYPSKVAEDKGNGLHWASRIVIDAKEFDKAANLHEDLRASLRKALERRRAERTTRMGATQSDE